MSPSTSLFETREATADCAFRLVVMPDFSSDDPSLIHLLTSSFEEAVRTKLVLGHTFLFLSEHRLMPKHPSMFFIERFDEETQEWVHINEEDSPVEHGLDSDADTVDDYIDAIHQSLYSQYGLTTGE